MHLSKTRLGNMDATARFEYLVRGCDPDKLKRFKKFHYDNLHVFDFVEEEAARQYSDGWRKSSVWLILNNKRWGPGSTVDTETQYKISNDYFAFYARLLIANNPRYVDWVELKCMNGQAGIYTADSFSGKAL